MAPKINKHRLIARFRQNICLKARSRGVLDKIATTNGWCCSAKRHVPVICPLALE